MKRLAILIVVVALGGCIDHPDPPVLPAGSQPPQGALGNPQAPPAAQPGTPPGPKDPLSVLTEVVYVLMDGWDESQWMCTGTLVTKDLAITAAHCLDESEFTNFRVVAPLAGSKPRVTAGGPISLSGNYRNIRNPDIGFLRLDEPIELPQYAQLTDVSARVEAGEALTAIAVVRTAEEFEAPFKSVPDLAVRSTIDVGYAHGFATPLFSHGGDSGAGLFLVENGQPTHKLIAVARQPEPDRKLDHFTRIDPGILEWFTDNTNVQ
jgi:hypothetical protein